MVSTGLYLFVFFVVVLTTFTVPNKLLKQNHKGAITFRSAINLLIGCSIPILIYTVFWGIRDEVGTDYLAYVRWFEGAGQAINEGGFAEYTFLFLCHFLSLLGFSYLSLFVVTSFVNIAAVYLSAWNTNKVTLVLSVYFYFTTSSVFFAQNGLRQAMASSILLIGIHLIQRNKYIPWLLIVVLAFFTHNSSIIFALFITLLNLMKPIHIKPFIIWVIYVILEFVGYTLQELLFSGPWSLAIATILGYENQIAGALEELGEAVTYSSGLGRYLRIILNTIVIFKGAKFTKTENKDFAYFAYWIFIVGICLHQMFASNLLLKRVAILFSWLEFPCMAYVAADLWNSKKKSWNLLCLIILLLGSFLVYYVACNVGSNGVGLYRISNF